ncbi:MAG TPA: PhzF family phenazine biosynthesis protein [Isosphaeraceae bacterium]|jgi:PhzF family phenazine biosynthesis protein|nr:PhzF family phenazine biosynthesis protein [Isosphaeraceae bacterium]
MRQTVIQVDAFTDRPFAGNPAAVCVLAGPVDERWMQLVAREMNLSETAFLHPEGDGFRLRWFTPTIEVDLCGHATLASAHVLWEEGILATGAQARFQTRSGLLTAERNGGWITMDFPGKPVTPAPAPAELARALGVPIVAAGSSQFDLLAEVESEETVRSLAPDLELVQKIPARGLIVTGRATTPGYDFVSRFFAPRAGVPEDPVTGSAHCTLGPYWAERLGKSDLVGYQASARGGAVRVRVEGQRVLLSGQALTVLRGELLDLACEARGPERSASGEAGIASPLRL